MTKFVWFATALLFGGSAFGAGVRVLRGEGVAESLAEGVARTFRANANIAVSVEAGPAREDGEAVEAHALRAGGGGDGVALVLVDWPGEEVGGRAWQEEGVALLNVALLGEGNPSAEVLSARAEREALRAYAHLLGLPPCPFPLCVLTHCPGVVALDDMARSYCPPCWEKIRDTETAKGFEVLPVVQPKEQEN